MTANCHQNWAPERVRSTSAVNTTLKDVYDFMIVVSRDFNNITPCQQKVILPNWDSRRINGINLFDTNLRVIDGIISVRSGGIVEMA